MSAERRHSDIFSYALAPSSGAELDNPLDPPGGSPDDFLWQRAFDGLDQAAALLDTDLRFVCMNRAARDLYGLGESWTGRRCDEGRDIMGKACRACPVRNTLRTQHPQSGVAGCLVGDDQRWLRVWPVFGQANRPAGVLVWGACGHDPAFQRDGERSWCGDWEIMEDMTALLSHDVRDMLSAIGGYSHLAVADLEDGGPVREHLEHIIQAANRATVLIGQVLGFTRGVQRSSASAGNAGPRESGPWDRPDR